MFDPFSRPLTHFPQPTYPEISKTDAELVKFYQNLGAVPTKCPHCSNSLLFSVRPERVDGVALRCRACRKRVSHRPAYCDGLEGPLSQQHQHLYLCSLGLDGTQRCSMLGISEEQTVKFTKRFRNLSHFVQDQENLSAISS